MLLTRLLNACHHFPGFVYEAARLIDPMKTIEIDVRPRKGSQACCSGCSQPARGYDQLPERRFELIPVWGFAEQLLYSMRRVECRACGVKVEEVPWGMGIIRLLRHVEALSGSDREALHERTEYPGSLSHRRQAEQGPRRGACQRSTTAGEGWLRTGAEEIPLVSAQAQGKSHRRAADQAPRRSSLQPSQPITHPDSVPPTHCSQ